MTSSTTQSDPHMKRPTKRLSDQRGFTLTELVVAATVSVIVLAGILTTFLMLGRTGANVANYSDSEAQIRKAVEEFSQDVRMASAITWNSPTSVTLTVPDNYTSHGNQVTYAYDASSSGDTALSFYRMPGTAASTADKTIYVRHVSSFAFERYNRLDATAANDLETKRVQITLNVRRTQTSLVAASTILVSASYILRNKTVN